MSKLRQRKEEMMGAPNGEPVEAPEFYDPSENTKQEPIVTGPKIGRNDPCPCGSGKKYKQCHGRDL
jgi:preprotein translocase subunit SecA